MKIILKQTKNLAIAFFLGLVIFILVSRLTVAPVNTPAASPLIRGVWLSHLGNAWLTYTAQTDNAFHQLSRLDYNRVYLGVYNDGTIYPSQYTPRNYLVSLPFTNPLKTAIQQAKRQGLEVYAWYEHGMMTFPQAKLAQQHPDWILATKDNEQLINKHWWLDPDNPQVQEYFVNLLTEIVTDYPDLYGIQLDDHWGIPIQFGDKSAAMTELTKKVVAAVRTVKPNLVISLSPNPLGFSRKKYGQNWLDWINEGLIDELVMQLYRPTSAEVALAIDNSILPQISQTVDVAVGIYAGGLTGQKSLAEIQQQISTVRQYGYGYAIFPWKTSFGILRRASQEDKESWLIAK